MVYFFGTGPCLTTFGVHRLTSYLPACGWSCAAVAAANKRSTRTEDQRVILAIDTELWLVAPEIAVGKSGYHSLSQPEILRRIACSAQLSFAERIFCGIASRLDVCTQPSKSWYSALSEQVHP